MREVHKKSADPAVNQMLIKACKQNIDLTWDRAEAMQPQCGFGRLGLCCIECQEGPCRVNPFASEDQLTICGRDRHDLVVSGLLNQVEDGVAALAQLAADFGTDCGKAAIEGDNMFGCDGAADRIAAYGASATAALHAILAAKAKWLNAASPAVTEVNFGVLDAAQANIILYGHVAPAIVRSLAEAAATAKCKLVTLCGNEVSGLLELPVMTNYDSQELPLLTGAVDLVVIGKQCVMPAVPRLAMKLGIPVIAASKLVDTAQVKESVERAREHFRQRVGKTTEIPQVKAKLYTNYTAANSASLLEAIAKGYAQGKVRGLLYFGGCGNIANTQDTQLVKLAAELVSEGYVLVAAGCAGTALAKAGLCTPDKLAPALKEILPADTPAVIHLGSCHDAAQFLAMKQAVSGSGVPVYAVMPELVHNKILATAVAFVSQGITVFVDAEWLGSDEQAIQTVNQYFATKTGSCLLTWKDFRQVPQTLAEVAAAK